MTFPKRESAEPIPAIRQPGPDASQWRSPLCGFESILQTGLSVLIWEVFPVSARLAPVNAVNAHGTHRRRSANLSFRRTHQYRESLPQPVHTNHRNRISSRQAGSTGDGYVSCELHSRRLRGRQPLFRPAIIESPSTSGSVT